MQAGLSVERVMGGMERTNLTADEKKQIKTDQDFEIKMVNDEYVKEMKSKANESIYIE
jgi:hypothetical protein